MPVTTTDHELLVEQLRSWSDDIVAGELRRLAGRLPQLTDADLCTIRGALAELVEGTLLARARALPDRSAHLRRLFALDTPARPALSRPPAPK